MSIAVTGATGHLGRLAIDNLLRAGVAAADVVAVVRNPAKAIALSEVGVAVRIADYNDRASVQNALAGVEKLLLISSSELGSRITQHANVIDAAKHAEVPFLAYTSVLHADTSRISLAAEHRATEEAIAASGIDYTFLRNGWYWENFTANVRGVGLGPTLQTGTLLGVGGDGRIAGGARADYAAAATAVITTAGHAGKKYELGGQRLSYTEFAAVISEVTATSVTYQNLTEDQYRSTLIEAGLPEAHAATLASYDAGVARGELDTQSGDLQTLIGRVPTPAADVIRAAYQLIPSNR